MKFKFNVPNNITLIRVALIPLFAFILIADMPYRKIIAAFIFVMLSISDFLDGYFARKKRQVTEFGKLIDPIADKLLISTALVFLVVSKDIDLWIAAVIISREVILTAVRLYLVPGKIVVPASSLGKAKTVLQSIAIVFVLLNLPFSWHIMILALVLTVISGLEYLVRIRSLTGNKVVNLPNLITLVRFLLIIPYVYYFWNLKINFVLILFGIITLSDKLDGISARIMNQRTELGSGLDSFTDWTLIISTFSLLFIKGRLQLIWVLLLVMPSMISGLMKIMYARKLKTVPVTFVARLSVGMTYVTIIAMFINFSYSHYLLIMTVVLIYVAMIVYVIKAMGAVKISKARS